MLRLIAAAVGALALGAVLLAATLDLLVLGDGLMVRAGAWLAPVPALGFALAVLWCCRLARRLQLIVGLRDDGEGGGGLGGRGDEPPLPRLPSGDPAWWPQFERDLNAYIESRRAPVMS